MTNIRKPDRNLLILFVSASILFFVALKTAPLDDENTDSLDGYVQIAENAVVPLLLSGQEQQTNLQLNALIQSTPIQQIRIYELSSNLLLRAQNISAPGSVDSFQTITKQVRFEGTAIGDMELDISLPHKSDQTSYLVWAFLMSALLGGLVTVLAYWITASKSFGSNKADNKPGRPLHATNTAHSDSIFPAHESILIYVRIYPPISAGREIPIPAETGMELAEGIRSLAEIYDAELVASAPNRLVFSIAGRPNKQRVQQALVLCFGLSDLSNEDLLSGAKIPEIQCTILDCGEIQAPSSNIFAYWSELEAKCSARRSGSAFVVDSFSSSIDKKNFETSVSENGLIELTQTSDSIKRLWENQRARIKI